MIEHLVAHVIDAHIRALSADRVKREDAVQALIVIGAPAVPALIDALKHADSSFPAATALTSIGQPAIQPLIEVLHEPSYSNFAYYALQNMGRIRVPAFLAAVDDSSPEVRMWAITALAEVPDECAFNALVRTLNDPDVVVRQSAIEALETRVQNDALPHLRKRQQIEPDKQLQERLATAIKNLSQRHSS